MNKIKELRKKQMPMLTQDELSKIAGVSKRTIIAWENGERPIKPEKAQQLADYFEVSVGYLLGYQKFYDIEKDALESSENIRKLIQSHSNFKDVIDEFEISKIKSGKFVFSLFNETDNIELFEKQIKKAVIKQLEEDGEDVDTISDESLNKWVDGVYKALDELPITYQEFLSQFLTLSINEQDSIMNLVTTLYKKSFSKKND